MVLPPRGSAEERLATAQAAAAAAATAAAERKAQEQAEISRLRLASLLKLDAATRAEALTGGASDLVPTDRRRLLESLGEQTPPHLSGSDLEHGTTPRIIRRSPSPETMRRLESAAETDRLKALPSAELVAAVTAGAMADLTEEDRQQVLDVLVAAGHTAPAAIFAPGARPLRKPLPMTGKGLSCEPGRPPEDPRIRVWVGCVLALIAWCVAVWLGYAGIVPPTFESY